VIGRRWGVGAIVVALAGSAYLRAPDATQFLQFTVLGVAAGAVYAIAASGVVLTYTTTGVFNFAHGGLGMVAAFVYWQLRVEVGLPTPVAVLVVLGVLGPLLGGALELMFRGLRRADVSSSIVLTIAVTVLCIGGVQYVFEVDEAHNLPSLLAGTVRLAGTTITRDAVLQIAVAVAIAAGLRLLLFRSRAGTTMRAVVDDPHLAALNGASSVGVARWSWILGTELAMVAGILVGSGTNLDAVTLTFVVVNAYGAAVVGRLRSLPLTFAGAVGLGLVQNWGPAFWFPRGASDVFLADGEQWRRIALSLPGLFLFVAVLFLPQARLAVGRRVSAARVVVPDRRSAVVRSTAFVAAVLVLVQVLPSEHLIDAQRAMVFAVILLSLVVLTGYSGLVSLAQYVFVAMGAWAMGNVLGGASLLGLVAAAVAPLGLAAVVALPTLRLQGLYLALVTFGFASVSRDLLIQDPAFFGGDPVRVGRPELLGISFAGDRAFIVLCAICFVLVAQLVLSIRRGSLGRRLRAVRDSEAACATLGLDTRATKFVAFCLSASIAGLGGALFGGSQLTVSDIPFEPINNIVLFLFAVVGGVTTVTGALLGGVLFALLPYVQAQHPQLAGLVFAGIAAVAIGLGRQPDGLAGVLIDAGRRLRRLVAGPGRIQPPARSTRAWGSVVALIVGGSLTLFGVSAAIDGRAATAQVGALESSADPFASFGGFTSAARAGGLQVGYDVQGVLPLPPPLLQVTVPSSRSSSSTGPSSLAFGSVAYPGDLVGNLPSLVEQTAPGSGSSIPDYPIAALAEFPKGPEASRQDLGTASASVRAVASGADTTTWLAGSHVPGVLEVGAVTATCRTGLEGGRVVARARSHVSSVSVLGGLVELRDVVSDVVAVTDGSVATTDGSASVGSATLLGQAVGVGPDGLEAGPTLEPVNALLEAAGIRIGLTALHEDRDGQRASVSGAGLEVELTLDDAGLLAQLVALVPTEALPGTGLPGVPLNTSPQAVVNLLKETHVVGVALAPVRVSVDASPPATATTPGAGGAIDPGRIGGGAPTPSVAEPGFSTPLPDLAAVADAGSSRGSVPGRAVGMLAVLVGVLTLPVWGRAAARLMDVAMADPTGCETPPDSSTRSGDGRI
jgi:branched-chain amino acid transport system permease protein